MDRDDDHGKITPKGQVKPDGARNEFLQGVMDEAHDQGYSKRAMGRLVVVALRTWEDR